MRSNQTFSFTCPTEVFFGVGASKDLLKVLPRECTNVVFVTGSQGAAASKALRELRRKGFVISVVRVAGEPTVSFIDTTYQSLKGAKAHVVVACGGGSVIDSGKALAFMLSHSLSLGENFHSISERLLSAPCEIPCIALPTTAGTGAEVTANAVLEFETEGAKISLRGRALYPRVAIVDPALMRFAPAHVVLGSGLDAVTQVIEAYTSISATEFSDLLSKPAIETGLRALRDVVERDDIEAWSRLSWVSLSSGLALANSGLGAAHGLASILGAQFQAPHGALCGRLLLPVLKQNLNRSEANSFARGRLEYCRDVISKVFPPSNGTTDLSGMAAWIDRHNLPRLSDWSVNPTHIVSLAERGLSASSSKKNAVALNKQDFIKILEEAV